MKRIAVAVQGPSDKLFWDRVLHRSFEHARFDVRDLKSQSKLVMAAPALIDSFRAAKYDAVFLLLDADEYACIGAVRAQLAAEAKLLRDPVLEDVRPELERMALSGCKGRFEQEHLLLTGSFPYEISPPA